MQIKRAVFAIVSLFSMIVALAWIQNPTTVNAQEQDNCRGVDLVVLLDQSRSMERNDPGELRADAARLIVDSLGYNILYDCEDEIHRLAVIGFGDQPNNGADTTTYINVSIAPDRDKFNQWDNERKISKDSIPQPGVLLGGTDFLSAFQQAKATLDNWASQPIGTESRLRGVVLIADGGPCVIDSGCGDAGMNWRAYLEDIRNYLNPIGDILPFRGENNPESVRIWFVGFRDTTAPNSFDYLSPSGDYGDALLKFWQEITEQHGGRFVVLNSSSDETRNRDVNKQVALIMEDITGSEFIPTTCTEPFYIDPYLDQTIIRILKIGSDPGIELADVKVGIVYEGPKTSSIFADGNADGKAGRVADYISDGPNELYVIESPAPGIWKIQVENADECRDLDVRYRVFPLKGDISLPESSLPQYDETPYYDVAAPYFFNVRVIAGKSRLVIFSDPEFPLSLVAAVSRPDGVTQTQRLRQDNAGQWQGDDPLELPVAGTYTWQVTAESPDGAKKGTIRHFTESGTFKVQPVQRFVIDIAEPGDDEQVRLNEFVQNRLTLAPIRIAAKILDAVTGDAITSDQIAAGNGAPVLSAQIVTLAGISEPIPMAYDPGTQSWTSVLTPGEQNVPISTDVHEIVVRLNEDAYNQESYRPAATNGRQATTRINRSMVLAGEIAVPTQGTRIAQEESQPFYDVDSPIYFAYRLFGYDLTDSRLRESLASARLSVNAEISLGNSVIQTFALAYDPTNGLWMANQPLLVEEDGQYIWKVDVSAISDADKGIVTPYSDSGNFTVTRVGRFHVDVLKPENGKPYPLNRIVDGQPEDIPLPVQVKIIDDETLDELTDTHLKAGINASQVVSVTVQAGGQTSRAVALTYDSNDKSWVGMLQSGLGETPDATGEQTLVASIDYNAFDRSRYRSSLSIADQDRRTFERVLIRPIELQPTVTELSSALYSGTRYCLNSQPVPMQVYLAVVSRSGGQSLTLDPSQIVSAGAVAIVAELINPANQMVLETGQIEVVQSGADKVLRVTLGTGYTEAGQYQIRITTKPDALIPGYEFLHPADALLIPVERTTDWRYAPQTCGIIKATGAGLITMLLLWMIFCFVRRPVGLLEIYDDRGNLMTEFPLGRGLFFMPRQTIKWQNDPSISKMVVTRGSGENVTSDISDIYGTQATSQQTRAIDIRVYDESGSDLGSWTLGSGQQPTRITIDSQFKYT